jgi:hypothetical protein
MSPSNHAARCLDRCFGHWSAKLRRYDPASNDEAGKIMSAHRISLGLLATALLAGTATIAHAWPGKKELSKFEYEAELPTDIPLELDASFPLFEPSKEPALGFGAAPPAPNAATAFSRQEAQSAIARAIKSGYSVSTEQLPAEMNRGYVVSDSFQAGIRAGFDAPVGDEMRFTAAGAEAKLNLGQLGPAISWGWHTGLDMALQTGGTNAVESGPQFKLGGNQLALTLSPKVAHSFGTEPHHERDVAFAYAAGIKGEVTKGVALGIEAFGSTSDIASVPGTALQTHRTTPGLYVGLGLAPQPLGDANGSKFSIELGALADMSEAQPDWTGKLKAAVTW